MIPSDGGADPSLALDAVTSGRGAPGHAFPSTVSPGCLRSSGSAAPVRRSPPARAQSMPTCTRKGRRQEQSCKGRTSRAVNRAILLHLGRHVPRRRRRPLWRSPPWRPALPRLPNQIYELRLISMTSVRWWYWHNAYVAGFSRMIPHKRYLNQS
ncbi:hypothetical protein VPH35_066676 [Triticum aestivum]|uniref:Uncharacterized protein n=2 Tax=Triticum TaxID=4564 RepID=A0A8R7U685_TRIUA|nr:unnamed protein product [Triticum turgidum subsp. durum]